MIHNGWRTDIGYIFYDLVKSNDLITIYLIFFFSLVSLADSVSLTYFVAGH